MFSFKGFIDLALTFKSLIYYELIFVYGLGYGSKFNLMQVDTQLFQCSLLKRQSSYLDNFVKNQLTAHTKAHFRALSSIPVTRLLSTVLVPIASH